MLKTTFNHRKLEIGHNVSYIGQFKEGKHFVKPYDLNIMGVEYHLASYVDYTSPTSNLVHEPILLNGTTQHSVVDGAVYTFYGESVLTESENRYDIPNQTFSGYTKALAINISSGTYTFGWVFSGGTTDGAYNQIRAFSGTTQVAIIPNGNSVTISQDIDQLIFYGGANNTNASYTNIMVASGTTALPYTPYFAPYYRHKGVRKNNKATSSGSGQGITTTKSNDLYTINGTITQSYFECMGYYNCNTSHFYAQLVELKTNPNNVNFNIGALNTLGRVSNVREIGKYCYISKPTSSYQGLGITVVSNTNLSGISYRYQLIDLTEMFGWGNEPTDVADVMPYLDCNTTDYYIKFNNTLYNIGTSPLIEGNTYSTNGVGKQSRATYTFTGNETWNLYNDFWYVYLTNISYWKNNTKTKCPNGLNIDLVNNTQIRVYANSSNPTITTSTNMNSVFSNGTTIEYDLATATTSVGQAYECDSGLSGADLETPTHYLHCDKVEQVRVKTNNLIYFNDVATTTTSGITWNVTKGVINVSGTATSTCAINLPYVYTFKSGSTYSFNLFESATTNQESDYYGFYSDSTTSIFAQILDRKVENKNISTTTTSAFFRIRLSSGITYNHSFKPMLVEGSTPPTEYAPYYNVSTQPNAYLPSGQVQNNLHSSEVTCVKVDNATKYAQCKAKSSPQFNFDTEAIDLLTTTLQNEYFSVNECLCIYAEPSTTPITTPSTKTMQAQQQVEIVGKQLSIKVARQL